MGEKILTALHNKFSHNETAVNERYQWECICKPANHVFGKYSVLY